MKMTEVIKSVPSAEFTLANHRHSFLKVAGNCLERNKGSQLCSLVKLHHYQSSSGRAASKEGRHFALDPTLIGAPATLSKRDQNTLIEQSP